MPRNVPPATTVAPSPCSALSASASSSDAGAMKAGSGVTSPQQLDDARGAVDADAVAGLDALARVAGADDGRDAELARHDRRMRNRAARLGDEAGDLREEHDPGRVRHPAHEDLALLHLVELVQRGHEAGRP